MGDRNRKVFALWAWEWPLAKLWLQEFLQITLPVLKAQQRQIAHMGQRYPLFLATTASLKALWLPHLMGRTWFLINIKYWGQKAPLWVMPLLVIQWGIPSCMRVEMECLLLNFYQYFFPLNMLFRDHPWLWNKTVYTNHFSGTYLSCTRGREGEREVHMWVPLVAILSDLEVNPVNAVEITSK